MPKKIHILFLLDLEHKEAYHLLISNKDVLEIPFLKLVFAGTPRVGKTTVLRRIMGKIKNLIDAGEADVAQPSTGAVESKSSVFIRKLSSCTTLVTKVNWSIVESDADEASMLLQKLLQNVRSASTAPSAATAPTQSKTSLGQSSESSTTSTSSSPPASISDMFKEASALPKFSEEVNKLFGAYLRIEDTGGQPELMDMLPALTIGPGLYLLFFNLEWSLNKEFSVFYQHPSGKATTPEKSKITLEEMLLSTLSSIFCSQKLGENIKGDNPNSSDIPEILKSSKSVAYLVGTHKDKVSEEKISQLDEDLQSVIKETYFYTKKLVRFCSEDKLIVTMNNMEGGVEEIEAIKRMLDNAIREFKELPIPVAWLFLNLCLHRNEDRTTNIDNVLKLSSQFNISKEETKVALWFLHHHAGVLMYFPNVSELNDLVILDNQVVYDSVTKLILKGMTFGNVGQASAERFRETGQFLLQDLLDATAKVPGGDLISPEKLIVLLEFLHIIAPIPGIQHSQSSTEKQEIVYLMPCVLRISNKEMLDAVCNDKSRPRHIAPLIIRYKCGFVPLGIFPALIASLISTKLFRLVEEDIMKNKVQFHYGDLRTLVSLLCYPKFYAIIISELPVVECDIQEQCVAIRMKIEMSLATISTHMNYANFMDYQFAFHCPKHSGAGHLCVKDRESACSKVMVCIQNPKRPENVKMEPNHMVWFGKVSHHIYFPSLKVIIAFIFRFHFLRQVQRIQSQLQSLV